MTTITTPVVRLPVRPRPSVRTGLARRVLASAAGRVPVEVRLPDGSLLGRQHARAGDQPMLEVVRPEALYRRIAAHPKIGIGEGYVAGDWRAADGTDLAELLLPFAERLSSVVPPVLTRLRRLVDRPIPSSQRNSLRGSRRNIESHYDLSNDLFAAFLDDTMTYSSALFDESRPYARQDLTQAQLRKVHAILDQAGVRAGTRLLEVGTGWGALAVEAARRGATVTTVTLSVEQAALAQERIDAAGVGRLVEIRLQDYRQVRGTFDAVVSVEMIEAVGEEYWPTYFTAIDRLLAPGGVAAIQAILMGHDRYLATRRSYGWIQKHIFPGGLIPSLQAISGTVDQHTDLRVTQVHAFGHHYAETLRRWRRSFLAGWPEIAAQGFDEEFRRKWEFYLAYCEAGFDSGYLDVAHIRLARPVRGGVA
jgi:cyclopropane-fatty-acyl-phospholipid synthase